MLQAGNKKNTCHHIGLKTETVQAEDYNPVHVSVQATNITVPVVLFFYFLVISLVPLACQSPKVFHYSNIIHHTLYLLVLWVNTIAFPEVTKLKSTLTVW